MVCHAPGKERKNYVVRLKSAFRAGGRGCPKHCKELRAFGKKVMSQLVYCKIRHRACCSLHPVGSPVVNQPWIMNTGAAFLRRL